MKPRNKELVSLQNRDYYEANKERLAAEARERRASNAIEIRARDRARYAADPTRKKAQSLASAKRNAAQKAQYNKDWRAKNPKQAKRTRRAYMVEQRKRPEISLRNRIRCGIYDSLKRGKRGFTCEALTGWTMAELRAHLERQFLRGMSWENMGDWHVDHIVPLASFTITGPTDPEFRRAWALTNLRPMWAADNIRKGARREVLL